MLQEWVGEWLSEQVIYWGSRRTEVDVLLSEELLEAAGGNLNIKIASIPTSTGISIYMEILIHAIPLHGKMVFILRQGRVYSMSLGHIHMIVDEYGWNQLVQNLKKKTKN